MSDSAGSDFHQALRREIRGDVLLDDVSRGIYATDASLYQITPHAVVVPRDRDDVRTAVRLAAAYAVPILPRGGGTSLAGQTVGAAMVIDLSKHCNTVLELDVDARRVRVEPGLVRDELNAFLKPHGLHFAPDPATSSRANVGGMIGNNSSGTKSILYGKTIDHVFELEILLADGTEMTLGEMDAEETERRISQGGREAAILQGLRRIVEENREEIAERFPKTMRRVGGYPLDEFLGSTFLGGGDRCWNPAKILVGSEGTLGVVLSATLHLEPLPAATSLVVAHFESVHEAVRAVEPTLSHRPSAVEILDRTVLTLARENPASARLCDFLEGQPDSVLLIEFYGDSAADVDARAAAAIEALRTRGLGYAFPLFGAAERNAQGRAWEVRKNGLGLMLGLKGDKKPLPFIEDAAIPLPHLPRYVEQMEEFCTKLGVGLALYAHASVGVLHLRPILDLKQADDIRHLSKIAERAFELTVEYEGSWSSEHGDGLVRSAFNERFFGSRLYAAFQQVKELFDPAGVMNPGKIVSAKSVLPPAIDEDLRLGASYRASELPVVYNYRADGSFAAAVEMCSGVGQCRKTGVGTMCPSYIATREEEHSTRGRANALRLAMSGQLGADGMGSERLYETLDLCLGCKACKSECPSNVDMAKLKSEFLELWGARHGRRWRDRLVASSPRLARALAGPLAPLANALQGTRPVRRLQESLLGITRQRTLPRYARQPLAAWMKRRPSSGGGGGQRVALFADTYLSYHEPNVGRRAVELLEGCGYEVVLAEAGCCQRPRISGGFLRDARHDGERTLRALEPFLRGGVPVVVCEPSCASALVDDLPDLIADADLAARAASGIHMLEGFLAAELKAGYLDKVTFSSPSSRILIHGHCHQKALFGTSALHEVLSRVEGLDVAEIDAGCCGMAGSFGYEAEHVDVSRKIAEDRLLPALAELDATATVVACGTSCRHQIADLAGRQAVHWVEVLREPKWEGQLPR